MTQVTTTTQTKTVAVPTGSWGAEETVTEDLVLPKVLVVQPTSKMIQKYEAVPGELRSTLDGKRLAKKGEKLTFVPFKLFDTWIHSRWAGGRWEFDSITPRKTGDTYEYEEKDTSGTPTAKHERAINAYVLLPSEIDSGGALPYCITFKGAKTFQEGRKFVTLCKQLKMMNLPPASRTFSVRTEMTTNDKGTFATLVVEQGDKTTDAQMGAAYTWYQEVQAKGDSVKVDQSDLEGTDETTGGNF